MNHGLENLPFTFPVELEKHFHHGVLDAQLGVAKSAFQEQSALGTEYEKLHEMVVELEKKQATDAILKDELMALFGRRALNSLWDKQITAFTAKIEAYNDIVVSLKLKIKEINLESSFLALVLTLTAALIFISADFIISITVVSTQLLLDGEIFGDEKIFGFNPSPFIFSLALAAIPFIMKPAYDRLVEQPYKLNKNKNYFNILILLITLIALSLLINTGFVRLKDFVAPDITTEQNVNENSGRPLSNIPEPNDNIIPELPEFFTAFVVIGSGVLFAFGGAILLGMGLPELRKRLKRTRLKILVIITRYKIWSAEKKIEKLIELLAFYDRDEAKYCQGLSLDEKWKLLMEEMKKTGVDLAAYKELKSENQKHFKSKIHDYGHQMASELSEPKLKKQGLQYINQKTSPRPYILLRNNISQQ
jgi:hypothetical protein